MRYLSGEKDPKLTRYQRLRDLTQVCVRWGYRRLHVLVKREGYQMGIKQT